MIDSSGRRGLRSNGTLFDILPVGQVLIAVGGMLVVLFVLSKPEASAGLQWPGRTVFWVLHVGAGLLALWVASWFMALGYQLPAGTLWLIAATGVAGILVATPAYLLLDVMFESVVIDPDSEPAIDGWLNRLFQEIVEVTPWFLTCWFLINLPVIIPPPEKMTNQSDFVEGVYESPEKSEAATPDGWNSTQHGEPDSARVSSRPAALASDGTDAADKAAIRTAAPAAQKFLLSLPGIIGTDVVAVSSDLHYLNVWTVAGRTTVLGSLRDVVAELGDRGIQVHRSHWVSHRHVRRVVGNSRDAACILSNDLRIPVSRRRWKEVREHYGKGVIHSSESAEN